MPGDIPSPDLVGAALARLRESALHKYLWLQANVESADLTVGGSFTTRFAAFYRLRRSKGPNGWQAVYFGYLNSLRGVSNPPSFDEALRHLSEKLPPLKKDAERPIEASFTSKLLATLDPSRPVLDSEVLAHFSLKLPGYNSNRDKRLSSTIAVFRQLECRMHAVLRSDEWQELRDVFDNSFAAENSRDRVTDMKALDLVIWAARGGTGGVVVEDI